MYWQGPRAASGLLKESVPHERKGETWSARPRLALPAGLPGGWMLAQSAWHLCVRGAHRRVWGRARPCSPWPTGTRVAVGACPAVPCRAPLARAARAKWLENATAPTRATITATSTTVPCPPARGAAVGNAAIHPPLAARPPASHAQAHAHARPRTFCRRVMSLASCPPFVRRYGVRTPPVRPRTRPSMTRSDGCVLLASPSYGLRRAGTKLLPPSTKESISRVVISQTF